MCVLRVLNVKLQAGEAAQNVIPRVAAPVAVLLVLLLQARAVTLRDGRSCEGVHLA